MNDSTIAPPAAARTYARPEPATDPDCGSCGGAGWLRLEVADRNDPAFGKAVRCPTCNSAPLAEVQSAENSRAFSDDAAPRRKHRRAWWGQ